MSQPLDQIKTFVTSVAAVTPITPRVVRVTVAGGDLHEFIGIGPDQFMYVLLPPAGKDELTIDRTFTWTQYFDMPVGEQPIGAYYTVRHWRPERAELDLDFVLHEGGHACEWAAHARPGDPVALWGPRIAYEPPADLGYQLLVADETGLPAVAVILETADPSVRSRVIIEVADASEEQPLVAHDGIEVTWLRRDGVPAGKSRAVLDVVHAIELPDDAYVWGGGESRLMTAIRKHVRRERGLAREQVSLVGYWRHPDHPDEPDEEDDE